jgi:hypothetical protein
MNNKTHFFQFILALGAIFIFLLLVKVFDISYPLTLTSTTKTSELAVVGEGKVEAVPDTAYVDVGITVNNSPTVEQAQKMIDDVNNKIIEAMKKLQIKKEDIKTSNYSIYPNYSYDKEPSKISGYNGNVTISIKVKNTQNTAKVIEEATKAGANNIQGTRFVIDNPQNYRELAREKAIKNAKEQAQKLTKNLGIKLGKIVNVVESTPVNPALGYSTRAFLPSSSDGLGGADESGAAFEPGSQTVSSVVTLYFEKK